VWQSLSAAGVTTITVSEDVPPGFTVVSWQLKENNFGTVVSAQSGGSSFTFDVDGDTPYILWVTDGTAPPPPPPPPPGVCPVAPNALFGLSSAGSFAVLGLTAGNVIISEGNTRVTGNVGVGPQDGGALLKATIDGTLFLDPTAHPDIHPDLVVTQGTVTQSLTTPVAAAIQASASLAGLPSTQTYGDITTNVTFVGNGGTNVISLNSVNLVKRTLTISGGANDVFIFNVAGQFNFASSQIVLNGVSAANVLWNLPGAGGDVDIFKSVTVAYGVFLAPLRNVELDGSVLGGSIIAGGTIKIHSAATVRCP
jgi:Ice-binding-like